MLAFLSVSIENIVVLCPIFLLFRPHARSFYSQLKRAVGPGKIFIICESLGEREMLWEHEPRASVFKGFSSSLKLSRVFLKSLEIRGTCLLFLLENTATKKAKRLVSFGYQKCKFSFLAPSLRQRPVLWAWLKMFFSPKRY